jgi:glycosyltransferase involved in cell wall biosynthesis
MLKVGMVSSIRPETNYTTYLVDALQKHYSGKLEVFAYCEKDPANKEVNLNNLRACWDRDWRYFFQVPLQAKKDRLDILHFQHEINMFGGPRTAVLFPFLVLLCRLLGFKPVVTVHAAVPIREFNTDFLKVFEWPRPEIMAPMVKIVFPTIYFLIGLFSKKIIVHSQGIKELLVEDYLFNGGKIEVIAHGVPEDINYTRSSVNPSLLDKLGDKQFLLYFGYFHRRKGLEYLIRAFKYVSQKYPDLILVLGGGAVLPNYSKEMESLIRSLGLVNRIIITGFLLLTDLRYLLDKCQFVVLPAIYSIAASGPLAQVFAHEKAVIVSDLGVYREEISDGVNGLLVRVGDAADLENKMELLLGREDIKKRLSNNVAVIKNERAWSKIAGKTLEAYPK